MNTLDPESNELLSEGDEVRATLQSRGWAVIKQTLDDRILDLQNIENIEGDTTDALMLDLKSRRAASRILFDWLRNDVYGFVAQQEANMRPPTPPEAEDFIGRDA